LRDDRRSHSGRWDGNRVGIDSSLLVDSHIIDHQYWILPSLSNGGGEGLGFSSEEVTSRCHIDQKEEWLIKRLSDISVWILSSSGIPTSGQTSSGNHFSIYEPLHLISFPDKSEGVITFREIKVEIEGTGSNVSIVGPRSSIMKCIGDLSGFLSSVFHDINFSRSCPSSKDIISGKHPKCWPKEISLGEFSSDFNSSILPSSRVLGVDSSGGESLVSVSFWDGFDVEVSVLNVNIVGSRSVALKLLILGTAVIFVLPLGSVESISIEFVLPDESIVLGVLGVHKCTHRDDGK